MLCLIGVAQSLVLLALSDPLDLSLNVVITSDYHPLFELSESSGGFR